MTTLQTERLTLREFHEGDLPALLDLNRRVEIYHYEPGPLDEDKVKNLLERTIEQTHSQPRSIYRLAITRRPDDRMLGRVSLLLNNSSIDEWEIGWTVHPDHWGQGLASEAARAMLGLAFGTLNAHRVMAICHAGNLASARVMEKIGMRYEGCLRQTRRLKDAWWDEFVYATLNIDWVDNH